MTNRLTLTRVVELRHIRASTTTRLAPSEADAPVVLPLSTPRIPREWFDLVAWQIARRAAEPRDQKGTAQ